MAMLSTTDSFHSAATNCMGWHLIQVWLKFNWHAEHSHLTETWDSHQAGAEQTLGVTDCPNWEKQAQETSGKTKWRSLLQKIPREQPLRTHNHLGQQCPAEGTARHRNNETFCQIFPARSKLPDWNESQHQGNVPMQREGLCVWNNHRGTNLLFDLCILIHDRLSFTLPCLRWCHQTHRIKLLGHWGDPQLLQDWHGSVSSTLLSPAPATYLLVTVSDRT